MRLLCYVLLTLIFTSCSSDGVKDFSGVSPTVESSKNNENYFASKEELESLKSLNAKVVDWKIARAFAEMERQKNEDYDWRETELSETPIIINDYKGNPLYYEFRVKRNNEYVGYITANANKTRGYPIAFSSDVVQDYSQVASKGEDYKLVSVGYPSVAYAPITKGLPTELGYNIETGAEVELFDEDYDNRIASLKNNQELRQAMNLTDEKWDEIYNDAMIEKEKTLQFWDTVEEAMQEATAEPETEILKVDIVETEDNENENMFGPQYKRVEKNTFILDAWRSHNLGFDNIYEVIKFNSVERGFCGNGAMAIIIAGFDPSLRKGDKSLESLRREVRDKVGKWKTINRQDATLLSNLNKAFELISSNRKYKWYDFYYDVFSSSGGLQSYLRSTEAPMLTLTSAGKSLHWAVLYGAGDYYNRISFHFFTIKRWRFKRILIKKDLWIPVKKRYFIDNGAMKGYGNNYFTKDVNWFNGFAYIHYPLRK